MTLAIAMRAFHQSGGLFSGRFHSGRSLNGVVGDGARHPAGFRRGLLGRDARNDQKPLAEATGMTRGITMRAVVTRAVYFPGVCIPGVRIPGVRPTASFGMERGIPPASAGGFWGVAVRRRRG